MPRNSSGTYSLPAGNPVVSNTLIQSTWANNTCSDLGTSITDSLDRNGRGAMLAALKNIDGTAVAPAITFSSEGTLGIYRPSAGVLGIAAGGALVLSIAAAGLTFTNPLVIPIGSATAPSLTFVSNTNTGIYSPATNQVAITNNGVQRLLVDASGVVTLSSGVLALSSTTNVIEASSGTGALQIQTGGANTRLTIDSAGNFTFATPATFSGAVTHSSTLAQNGAVTFPNAIGVWWKDGGAVARRGAVLSSADFYFGDVDNGITGGLTHVRSNAGNVLEVNGSAIVNVTGTQVSANRLLFVQSGSGENIRMSNDSAFLSAYNSLNTVRSGYLQFQAGGTVTLSQDQAFPLAFATNATTRMSIDASGWVGVGIAPISTVKIAMSDGTITTLLGFNYSSNTVSGIGTNTAHALGLLTNGSERLRIDTSGNVGIATAPTTTAKLTIGGGLYVTGAATLPSATGPGLFSVESTTLREYVGDGTGYSRAFAKRTASTTTDLITIQDSGNVGIGRVPSGYTLDVAGALRLSPPNTSGPQIGAYLFDGGGGGGEGCILRFGCQRVADMADIWALGTGGTGADLIFATNSADGGSATERLRITSVGVIQDGAGLELGWKGLPQNNQAAGYTLTAADRGKHVYMSNTGGVTVPSGIFSTGDVVTIVNGEGSSTLTITQGASTTLYQTGTTNTGNRTLLAHGIATVLCVGSNAFFISGNIS